MPANGRRNLIRRLKVNGVPRERHVFTHLFQITTLDNKQASYYFVVRFPLQIWLNVSQIKRKYTQRKIYVFFQSVLPFNCRATQSCSHVPAATWRTYEYTTTYRGTRWGSWLRHCATSRKIVGSIPNCVIRIFHWHNPSGRTMALELTQPLTEMSTRNSFWG